MNKIESNNDSTTIIIICMYLYCANQSNAENVISFTGVWFITNNCQGPLMTLPTHTHSHTHSTILLVILHRCENDLFTKITFFN